MTSTFATDYQSARSKFIEAAAEQGAALESIAHPERGPDGREIFTDVALLGDPKAEAVLVMISGTHGVEGFCGSGAQVDWLRRGEAGRLAPSVAALLVHAINPYGFAWLRRTTHENIDLNRNWIDFSKAAPQNPGYAALRLAIVPERWTDAARAEASATLGAYAHEHGFEALVQALSGGQYDDARGIFYGGAAPAWSRRQQTAIVEHYLVGAARVAFLDYHTGLGAAGYAEPISTFAVETGEFRRACAWYGRNVVSLPEGGSSSALILGDGLSAAPALLPRAEVTPIALEYGTKTTQEVLEALRADAWVHAYGDPLSPEGQTIKRQVRDAFYLDTDLWRGMVLGQSLQACRQAALGLAGRT
ncbi:MAG: M14 family metallopeptidase [Caulobacteraceae bacterium]